MALHLAQALVTQQNQASQRVANASLARIGSMDQDRMAVDTAQAVVLDGRDIIRVVEMEDITMDLGLVQALQMEDITMALDLAQALVTQ